MKGLNEKTGRGYVVVRMNSTSGPWIVERTTRNQLRVSQAEIAGVWSQRGEAEDHCRLLNRANRGDERMEH